MEFRVVSLVLLAALAALTLNFNLRLSSPITIRTLLSKSVKINQTTIDEPLYNPLVIHRFWVMQADQTLNRKVLLSFKSSIRTQPRSRIIVWTPPSSLNQLMTQTEVLQTCASVDFEIRSTNELMHLLEDSRNTLLMQCIPSFRDIQQTDLVVFSDLLRFIALYFFGGIYADADMIFLKDMSSFNGLSFAYKWDRNTQYYNTALMGLPAKSPVVLQIIQHFGHCKPLTFWPSTIHEALTCSSNGICQELIMMPTALFSPVSAPQSNWQWMNDDDERHLGTTTDWFFDSERLWSLDHFFPGAFTFHWHNRWEHTIHPQSFFADLETVNAVCDSHRPTTCKNIYIDLGGYTGDTLALYGNATAQTAIYVFEIDPNKVEAILQRLNGPLLQLKPITQVLNVAVWNADTVLRVKLTGHNDGRVTADGETMLLAYDIGAWLRRTITPRNCDQLLLKLDIEGAEVEALGSLDRAGVLQFVDHLIIEWHDWILPAVASAKPGINAMLEKYGLKYQYATLDDQLQKKYLPGEQWPVSHCDSHYLRMV